MRARALSLILGGCLLAMACGGQVASNGSGGAGGAYPGDEGGGPATMDGGSSYGGSGQGEVCQEGAACTGSDSLDCRAPKGECGCFCDGGRVVCFTSDCGYNPSATPDAGSSSPPSSGADAGDPGTPGDSGPGEPGPSSGTPSFAACAAPGSYCLGEEGCASADGECTSSCACGTDHIWTCTTSCSTNPCPDFAAIGAPCDAPLGLSCSYPPSVQIPNGAGCSCGSQDATGVRHWTCGI